jgi:Tfp pilus assembly protein PilV
VVKRVLSRLRAEDGFGLIELSIAMVMLNVGILAIVAAFNSGAISLARANKIANATVIADKTLERYRGYRNCQIYLDTSAPNGIPTTGTYASDAAYSSSQTTISSGANNQIPGSCSMHVSGSSWPFGMTSDQQAAGTAHNTSYVGPDGRTYIVDTYIVPVQVTNGGWQKKVTVVVRDPSAPTSSLVRESSTYDPYDAP